MGVPFVFNVGVPFVWWAPREIAILILGVNCDKMFLSFGLRRSPSRACHLTCSASLPASERWLPR